jgi:hypothetical protein
MLHPEKNSPTSVQFILQIKIPYIITIHSLAFVEYYRIAGQFSDCLNNILSIFITCSSTSPNFRLNLMSLISPLSSVYEMTSIGWYPIPPPLQYGGHERIILLPDSSRHRTKSRLQRSGTSVVRQLCRTCEVSRLYIEPREWVFHPPPSCNSII